MNIRFHSIEIPFQIFVRYFSDFIFLLFDALCIENHNRIHTHTRTAYAVYNRNRFKTHATVTTIYKHHTVRRLHIEKAMFGVKLNWNLFHFVSVPIWWETMCHLHIYIYIYIYLFDMKFRFSILWIYISAKIPIIFFFCSARHVLVCEIVAVID